MNLIDYIKLEELENKLFPKDIKCLGLLLESGDYEISSEYKVFYEEYKYLLYEDIIEETLTKTYDFDKFKQAIENEFKTDLEYLHDYKFQYPNKPNNNRCYIQANKKIINSDKFRSILDRYGFFISKEISDDNSIGVYIEPIYFSNKSSEINKNDILWHIVPCQQNSNLNLSTIKHSFQKKGGLKPSKREKISKHFRRTYVWNENQNINDIWDYIVRNNSQNHFILIKIDWKKYKEHQPTRKIEWFEDPNTRGGIWTREMISYHYLTFYELHSKEELKEKLNDNK